MLFDLRGPGRRRVVKVIYLSLALLMGGGLVLFGIGGDVQGGLFDAFRDDAEQSRGSGELERREERLENQVRTQPRNAEAWGELAETRSLIARQTIDERTGAFSEEGNAELRQAVQAWDRYVALDPPEPDPDAARLMLTAFEVLGGQAGGGEAGRRMAERGVRAAEILVDSEKEDPNPNTFFTLAQFAYAAGQDRKAKLASDRVLELTPREDRESVRDQLDALEEAATQQAGGGAGAGGGEASGVPPPASE